VIGAPRSYKIKVKDFAEDYKLAEAKAGAKGQIIASVRDTGFYQKGGTKIDTPPPRADVKYKHWVMIEKVEPAGEYFKIKIWTWAAFYDAKVHKNVATNYFASFVVAGFD
jgi:hypothetical protein